MYQNLFLNQTTCSVNQTLLFIKNPNTKTESYMKIMQSNFRTAINRIGCT
ncbi:hypothetical protein Hanom_Chr06g00511191 [Helianthus anomalus]